MIMFWRFHRKNTVVQSNFDLDIRFWKNDCVTHLGSGSHACDTYDDGPWPAHWAFSVNWCWDAGLRWTNSVERPMKASREEGETPVTTWLNMVVQTSIHRWVFCFFLFLFETFKRLLVSVYTSQLIKEHLSDLISTRLSIWHPLKLFTFIELCYVLNFRWACYSHNHMNQSVRWP